MPGSGIVRPKNCACGTVASTNFWRSSSLEKRLIFHLVEVSLCWLALSGGPNIISTGHHQRSSALCAIAFCSSEPPAAIEAPLPPPLLLLRAARQRQHDLEPLPLVKRFLLADPDHRPRIGTI